MSGAELPISEFLTPTLTTFEVPYEQIVSTAVDLLLKRLHGYSELPHEIIYPSRLIVRESTRKQQLKATETQL